MLEMEEKKMSRNINEIIQKADKIMSSKLEKEQRYLQKLKSEHESKQKLIEARDRLFQERSASKM